MPQNYLISPELEKLIKKYKKKDPRTTTALQKKMNEIINSEEEMIEHYKNLRAPINQYKRVHINKSFILIFSFNKKSKTITFHDISHHDDAYNKKLF